MNPEDAEPLEDTLLSLAASCDDALADGRAPDPRQTALVPEEHRSDLEGRIDCMRMLRRAWAGDSGATSGEARPSIAPTAIGMEPSLSPSVPLATHIGRFEVCRELGRGGFGVVFLAHDPLLDRDVALKVPRTEAFLDPQLRARLHREATIAAGLDHPNIVPIYEAGEAGPVCYIASAYCPGVTLAAWLKAQTVLAPFRDAAALTATLAEAVHYAHSRSVVHRDLKPANILLVSGGVVSGERSADSPLTTHQPKIADFGLAKQLDDKKGSAQALTLAGTFMGTPQYMAPEQAGTAAGPIGPATDVYALGVILYEMLAGRPPFQGDSTLDILRQVETVEPVPPGRLRPKLPRDLETICLKCLEKESRRRYPGADALAADLRRFLAGEPVHARPVSQAEKLWRWCRRKPAVAGLLAALVLVFLAGSGGVLWQWQRASRERDTAHQEKERAERHLEMIHKRVERMDRLGHELLEKPGMYRAGHAVLEQALAFYKDLLPEEGNDPKVRQEAAKLFGNVAWIQHTLGHAGEAAETWDRQARLLTSLLKEKPADTDLRMGLAYCHRWRGNMLRDLGQEREAREEYDQAAELQEELLRESPVNPGRQVALANTLLNTASVLSRTDQAKELEALHRRIVKLDRDAVRAEPNNALFNSELALALVAQGMFLLDTGLGSQAEITVREALGIHQKVLTSGQRKGYIERYMADNYVSLGRVLAAGGQAPEAEKSYRQAVTLLDRMVKEGPESAYPRRDLARTLAGLADLLNEPDRRQEALELRRRALHHYETLRANSPEDPTVNNDLAWFLVTTQESSLRDAARAVRLAKMAVTTLPEVANCRNTLGVAHYRNEDNKAAVAELETAMRLRAGGDSFDWFFLAMAHWRLRDHEKARTWFDRAVEWMDRNKPHDDELRRFRAEAEVMLAGARER